MHHATSTAGAPATRRPQKTFDRNVSSAIGYRIGVRIAFPPQVNGAHVILTLDGEEYELTVAEARALAQTLSQGALVASGTANGEKSKLTPEHLATCRRIADLGCLGVNFDGRWVFYIGDNEASLAVDVLQVMGAVYTSPRGTGHVEVRLTKAALAAMAD